ncbi:hypothetical protein A8U91_02010 [Halomonas elongata]|uniref:LysM domain-containing protein n=1 Tax=Halomonas elongata TaxID=2746 RepID=A0A1B8P5T7_HALEL|nr:hypothetical protein [Halomonas elongata]OBX37634.1 hypothetical protein A8U91_02010 [Halomonas elongata]
MNRWYRYGLAGLCCTAFFLSAAAPAHDPVETERYRVQPGDTLWEITERYRAMLASGRYCARPMA